MSTQLQDFLLVNLHSSGAFLFRFFPAQIQTTGRVNWQAQQTTTGVQPLLYANREPERLTVDELYLDTTETNESLAAQIVALKQLQAETDEGMPPTLLAVWGDEQFVGVLEDLQIRRTFFTPQGDPLRAAISVTLLEVQQEERSRPRGVGARATPSVLNPRAINDGRHDR